VALMEHKMGKRRRPAQAKPVAKKAGAEKAVKGIRRAERALANVQKILSQEHKPARERAI
jgi:hypothetical protein